MKKENPLCLRTGWIFLRVGLGRWGAVCGACGFRDVDMRGGFTGGSRLSDSAKFAD